MYAYLDYYIKYLTLLDVFGNLRTGVRTLCPLSGIDLLTYAVLDVAITHTLPGIADL